MAVQAAVTGDVDLLQLAMLHDPLVGAVCTPDEVWQMVDEMLVAQAAWLPQYAEAIDGAKRRLAATPARNRATKAPRGGRAQHRRTARGQGRKAQVERNVRIPWRGLTPWRGTSEPRNTRRIGEELR